MSASTRARPAPLSGVGLLPAILIGSALLVFVMLVATGIGAVTVPISDTWAVIARHLWGGGGEVDLATDQIIWRYRIPRVLLAALVGGGLGITGVILQAVANNALADPFVLGLSYGASLGAVLVIVSGAGLFAAGGVLAGLSVAFAAFIGSIVAIVLVFLLGQQRGRIVPTRLILSGVAVGYLLLAATNYIQLRATPNELRTVMFWTLGNVSGATWRQLTLVSIVVVVIVSVLLCYGRQLNALCTGEEQATALGVNVKALRIVLLVLASMLIGVLISAAGGIGFVGLIVPHIVRLAFGGDHRRVLPLSVLFGGVYLVAVDLLSRVVDPPNELPIGIFTAAFGAPFFLWLLRRNQSMGTDG